MCYCEYSPGTFDLHLMNLLHRLVCVCVCAVHGFVLVGICESALCIMNVLQCLTLCLYST